MSELLMTPVAWWWIFVAGAVGICIGLAIIDWWEKS